jgi:hypothetical protein
MITKIDFEYETPYGKYSDALIFEEGQPVPSPEEIEVLKLERLNNWIILITTPEPPVDEEVIEEQ